MESNSTLIIKVGGFLSSSSTITNMIIFNDAIYSILAIIGALLSLLGMLHEIWTDDKESKVISAIASLFRASILGAILTPMLFMAYIHMGGSLAKQIVGLDGLDGIFNSFWFLLSLITAWYSPVIWDGMLKYISNKFKAKVK